MYRDATVAVVVPAYNEEGYVGDVIADLPSFVDRAYVVEDGSTDGTWAEIRAAAAERNEAHEGEFEDLVVPIRHEENRGVGGAIKTGYQRATEEEIDVTAVLGGDDQMDPAELTKYLDPIVDGVAGYAKGNRFARAEDFAEMPRFRLLGNVILSYLTKIASGYWGSMDSQNGYTAISLAALEATDIDGMYEYYGYCNDLLVRLNAADVVVADVPRSSEYAYTGGWKSHIDYTEYVPRVSGMLLSAFLWRLRRKYLLEGYDPLAALYALGAGAVTTSVAGLLRAVARRRDNTAVWLLSTVVSLLTLLAATIRDREDNDELFLQVGIDDEPVRTHDSTVSESAATDSVRGGSAATDSAANGSAANGSAATDSAAATDSTATTDSDDETAVDGDVTDDVTLRGAR